MKIINLLKIICFVCLCWFSATAQKGNYYITNYTPSNYGASDQNWSVTQDSLGRLFVANSNGVMMYDGKYWKIIPLKDEKRATALMKSADGKIYVGGESEFGYLEFKPTGQVTYESLSQFLSGKDKEFGNTWAIQTIGKNVFFCSNERVFWFRNNSYKRSFSPTGEKFHTFFKVDNTLLVREFGKGFSCLKNGELKHIKGSEEFADIRVYAILPAKGNLYWVCSRNGLFTLSYNATNPELSTFTKNNSAIDKWMIDNEIYCGEKINQNVFALGSIKDGVLLVDANLKPINHINYSNGLQEDAVKYMYRDFSGNLWLALNKGLSYAEINTPLTHWTKANGIQGIIESTAKFNNSLYIATDKGVEKLNRETNTFTPTTITEESWDFLNYKDVLLAATEKGLFEMEKNGIKKIYDASDGIKRVFVSPDNENMLFLACHNTLIKGIYKNHHFEIINEIEDASGINSMFTDAKNRIFFGSVNSVIYMLDANNKLTTYTDKDSLPSISENYVFNYKKQLLVATGSGIYSFNETPKPVFRKEKKYNIFSGDPQITKAIQVEQDIWVASTKSIENNNKVDELSVLKQIDNDFVQDYKLLKRIRDLSPKCFLVDSGKVFIGTNDGLIEYNTQPIRNDFKFNTFISKIIQKTDTNIIFQNICRGAIFEEPAFEFKNNEISFFATASDYYDKNELEFSYYLEGKEENYSNWTHNNKISYNNLHEGNYVFHVKSRNILGVEGNSVVFSFAVLPPWYRTVWAYTLYFVSTILVITFIVRYNTKRLKEQNIKLEKIITERTKTIAVQKEEIEHKNQEITDSINYAKRIQQAILPPILEIKKVWKNLFVFYQPKDIVSGDFYWFHKISDEEILIACADCTGHGVPGGFMSMICSDKLNDAVKLTQDPAEILFHVNNAVKTALRQTNEENVNKDGMEIALLRVNFSTQKIWYSGANRFVWILKNKAEEIDEIKPTKASIASFTEINYRYIVNEIALEKGDLVYLTSDGYPDQFGGANGKKFMNKNLKKFILSIRNLPIAQQEELIAKNINDWMKGYEQVDDLLMIGIQI